MLDHALTQFGGNAAAIAQRDLIGGNRIANAQRHPSAANVSGAKWQHFARPLQSDGNQRNAGADRDVGGAFLERCEIAVCERRLPEK